MRTQEIKMQMLFDLVTQDYREHGRSLQSVQASLKHLTPVFAERAAERLRTRDVDLYNDARRSTGAALATVNL